MYAVIASGGKQYRVEPGQVVELERLAGEAGATIELGQVLLVQNDNGLTIGQPQVGGAVVVAQVVSQKRGPKIVVFKKQRRKNYRRTKGHRQSLTRVRITEIRI